MNLCWGLFENFLREGQEGLDRKENPKDFAVDTPSWIVYSMQCFGG